MKQQQQLDYEAIMEIVQDSLILDNHLQTNLERLLDLASTAYSLPNTGNSKGQLQANDKLLSYLLQQLESEALDLFSQHTGTGLTTLAEALSKALVFGPLCYQLGHTGELLASAYSFGCHTGNLLTNTERELEPIVQQLCSQAVVALLLKPGDERNRYEQENN